MPDVHLYKNDTEQGLHAEAIRRLARELSAPENEIRGLYEIILRCLKDGARISDYLVILVSRHVKDLLETGQRPSGPGSLS